jgi:DNA primase
MPTQRKRRRQGYLCPIPALISPLQGRASPVVDEILIRKTFERKVAGIVWGRNGQHKGLCPFHQDDKTKSFSFNDNGLWKCFGCDRSGNEKQFAQATGIDYKPMLSGHYTAKKVINPIKEIKVDTTMLRIKAEEYMNNLGNEDSFLQYNLVGKDENGRLTFPYFNDNMEVIAIKHHKGKNGEAPYWHKGGDNRAKWYNVWNLPLYKRHKSLIISEGEPDVIKLCKYGFQAICSSAGTNSVPPLIPRFKEWL